MVPWSRNTWTLSQHQDHCFGFFDWLSVITHFLGRGCWVPTLEPSASLRCCFFTDAKKSHSWVCSSKFRFKNLPSWSTVTDLFAVLESRIQFPCVCYYISMPIVYRSARPFSFFRFSFRNNLKLAEEWQIQDKEHFFFHTLLDCTFSICCPILMKTSAWDSTSMLPA